MNIKHLFFDLDRTLWDFETNSYNELIHLCGQFNLHQKGISLPNEFIKVYKKINEECWLRYRNNQLSKELLRTERFRLTLFYFGIEDDSLALDIGNAYVRNSPFRTNLIPGALDLIKVLKNHFTLHIITNGFEEVQHVKMKQSGLTIFFNHIITSELAGVKKPDPEIFNYALSKSGAHIKESVMIGDDLQTDIQGAISFGMKSIYFNPNGKKHDFLPWKEVKSLNEIKKIFL